MFAVKAIFAVHARITIQYANAVKIVSSINTVVAMIRIK